MTSQSPNPNRRAGIAVAVMVAVVASGIGAAAIFGSEDVPPPDEDAYVEALFTSKWDRLLPKRPFIEQGYEACELLRSGHPEQEATLTMFGRDTSTGTVPEKVRERYERQTVAAHKHLCPGT